MKKITVTISIELNVPDEWQIVEHEDGIDVLKINDKFCDFSTRCMTTTSIKAGEIWESDNQLEEKIMDYLHSEEIDIKEFKE
jgi:hypothetical protein